MTELFAVFVVIKVYQKRLVESHILIQFDNGTLIVYIQKEDETKSFLLDLTFNFSN